MTDNGNLRIDNATVWIDIRTLTLWKSNPNSGDIGAIETSIRQHGFNDTCHFWQGIVKAGNHSVMALTNLRADGWQPDQCKIPSKCLQIDGDTWYISMIDISEMSAVHSDTFGVGLNRTQRLGYDDPAAMAALLQEFHNSDEVEIGFAGYDADDLDLLLADIAQPFVHDDNTQHAKLTDKFIVPPFSVLDARQGYWQDRKRYWLSYGIKSELGRGDNNENGLLGFSEQARTMYKGKENATSYSSQQKLTAMQRGSAKVFGTEGNIAPMVKGQSKINSAFGRPEGAGGVQSQTGTSIFDPVLCELAYRWFCFSGGRVLDPFAGGSVRGIVASILGLQYTGIDLSERQILSNNEQANNIVPNAIPKWIVGDSLDINNLLDDNYYDFIFTCPPYYNLEIYSNDPSDISNADDYDSFIQTYREIIASAVMLLNDNRFACIVVGDVRKKDGSYCNFVSDTIQAFLDEGMQLYNEAILVTAVGSLPIRVSSQFPKGRKLGKTHQNVLVFIKGDWRKAVEACGEVEVYIPDMQLTPERSNANETD